MDSSPEYPGNEEFQMPVGWENWSDSSLDSSSPKSSQGGLDDMMDSSTEIEEFGMPVGGESWLDSSSPQNNLNDIKGYAPEGWLDPLFYVFVEGRSETASPRSTPTGNHIMGWPICDPGDVERGFYEAIEANYKWGRIYLTMYNVNTLAQEEM